MNAIQRALFCFTTMVTVAFLLHLFFGIRNAYSTGLIAVVVFLVFYARIQRREIKNDPQGGPN